jgi:hypothetical protein
MTKPFTLTGSTFSLLIMLSANRSKTELFLIESAQLSQFSWGSPVWISSIKSLWISSGRYDFTRKYSISRWNHSIIVQLWQDTLKRDFEIFVETFWLAVKALPGHVTSELLGSVDALFVFFVLTKTSRWSTFQMNADERLKLRVSHSAHKGH